MARNVLGTYKTSGIPVRQPWASSFGTTVFVDAANGNDDYTGDNPTNATVSVEQAVDQAAINGLDSTIIVRKGFYDPDETMALTSDHNGLRVIADNLAPVMSRASTMIYNIGGPDTIFSLNGCHNVEIAGFRLYPEMTSDGIGVDIAYTASSYGNWIHDNIIYAVEQDSMSCAIRLGLYDNYLAAYSMIENNFFYCGGNRNTGIGIVQVNEGIWSTIRNNYFYQISNFAQNIGITLNASTTAHRVWILDNHFNAGEIGVAEQANNTIWHAAALGAGDGHISGNTATNYSTPYSSYITPVEVFGANYDNHALVSST